MAYKLWVYENSKPKRNKAKQSLYRSGKALRAPEVRGSHNFYTIGTQTW